MPSKLSRKQQDAIYDDYTLHGVKQKDLAIQYSVAPSTICKAISDKRKELETMPTREKFVAGDKRNGRLMSCQEPNKFTGTCVVNGTKKSKTFFAKNAMEAQRQWEKWCDDLRDENAFMAMVERKNDNLPRIKAKEGEAVCGYPSDPIEEIKPIKETKPTQDVKPIQDAKPAQEFRPIQEVKPPVAPVVTYDDKPVYVLWAKTEVPKMYGAYKTMDAALKALDKLNEVARFLGNGEVFDVEEVAWKC